MIICCCRASCVPTQGSTVSEHLGILNGAVGPADLLSGSFVTGAETGFTNTSFTSFASVAAGSADTAPSIVLNTGTLGTFHETIVLDAKGSNASGYSGTLAPETLVVTGTVAAASHVAALATAASSNPDFSNMGFISSSGSNGNETLAALASGQTLNGGPGIMSLIGYSGFGDSFKGTIADLNGATIRNFGGSDLIDVTDLNYATASNTYSGSSTSGTLGLSDGGLHAAIGLTAGTSLAASSFLMKADGSGGTMIALA